MPVANAAAARAITSLGVGLLALLRLFRLDPLTRLRARPPLRAPDARREQVKRRDALGALVVHVPEGEQVFEAVLPPVVVAARVLEPPGVLERSEHDVEDRQVREVVGVVVVLVVDAVRLGPLDDEAEPVRRRDVPVVEELRHGRHQRVVHARLDRAAQQHVHDARAEQRVHRNLDGVLVERRHDLDPARRVVQLVAQQPEQPRLVPKPKD